MGLSGLFWSGFLLTHLTANLQIIFHPNWFNWYAYILESAGELLYVAELGLLVLLVLHIFLGIKVTLDNKKSRSRKYAVKAYLGENGLAARSMIISGVVLAIFLVGHIFHFKFGARYEIESSGHQIRDLHRLVVESFSGQLGFTAFYVVCMVVLAIHLSHGFQSAFQSLGLNHPKYMPTIKFISKAYAVILGVGFSFIAIWCFFQGGH